MQEIEQLQKEAKIKWGIEVGPNSTQRGQEKVLCELIAKAFLTGEKSGKLEGAKIAVEYAFSRIKAEGVIEGDDIRISHEQLAGILEVGRRKARTS